MDSNRWTAILRTRCGCSKAMPIDRPQERWFVPLAPPLSISQDPDGMLPPMEVREFVVYRIDRYAMTVHYRERALPPRPHKPSEKE